MIPDIRGRLVARRVTGDALVVRVLVDADVVDAQERGHVLVDTGVLRSEVVGHTQVHHHGHGLERDHALPDVAVRPDGAAV